MTDMMKTNLPAETDSPSDKQLKRFRQNAVDTVSNPVDFDPSFIQEIIDRLVDDGGVPLHWIALRGTVMMPREDDSESAKEPQDALATVVWATMPEGYRVVAFGICRWESVADGVEATVMAILRQLDARETVTGPMTRRPRPKA